MGLSYQPTLTLLLFPPFVPHTGHQLRLPWFRNELRTGGTIGEYHRYGQAQFTGKRDEEKMNSNNINNKRYNKKLFMQQTCFPHTHFHGSSTDTKMLILF